MLLFAGMQVAVSAEYERKFSVTSLKEIRERAVVMQQWDNSCAAAALATVLTYGLADPVSERYVAARMLETTDARKVKTQGGFSMLDMKRFVESRGYAVDAFQHLSTDQLALFRAPIVPIRPFGSNHYVVVNSITEDVVLLADPAFGNRSLTLREFKEMWFNGLAFVIAEGK
ncbi:MAG: hypothetical protein JWN94_572 [Betaproteobacteria bacterium]|nr:hypothetical protein [Betaproteobacteria bacterium]